MVSLQGVVACVPELWQHHSPTTDLCPLPPAPSLIVLIALNVLLFYRLWSLERTAHTFESWHSLALAKG